MSFVPPRAKHESVAQYLRRLDRLGPLLFHGSPFAGIEVLEPRPANDQGGENWGNDIAVFAVPAVIAVGRAILPPRDSIQGHWRVVASRETSATSGPITTISRNVELGPGSVYIVHKTAFHRHRCMCEWKSRQAIEVLAEVRVTPSVFEAMGGRIVTMPLTWALEQ